jgi:hypothetical protein
VEGLETRFIKIILTLSVICAGIICLPGLVGSREVGPNLVPNADFTEVGTGGGLLNGWHIIQAEVPGVRSSQVFACRLSGQDRFLALLGGPGGSIQVCCKISGIRPHADYFLEFEAFRPVFTNGVYLEVEIFGQRHLINQHLSYGRIQPIFLTVNSGRVRGRTRLVVTNPHPELLAFGSPSLRRLIQEGPEVRKDEAVRLPQFFPVGIFNARLEDFPEIRAAGFNAVQSYDPQPEDIKRMASMASRLGLKFLPNVRSYQAELSRELGGQPELLGFYIEDEPEGRSVAPEKLEALRAALQRDHPGVLTAVAMLRPQMVAEYRKATDIFMVDPYPVPNMPMTWLSDALEEAARSVSRERLWAVIQAFGGEKFRREGWPRPPTSVEMRCLSYLAVVHGAHGLFFFSYPDVRHGSGWDSLKQIVSELRHLRAWLMVPSEETDLRLEILSPFKTDANGAPAVHFGHKRLGQESLLIMVNVLDRPVEFLLHGWPSQIVWLTEVFRQEKAVVVDGTIRKLLGPYEVNLYRYRKGE